MTPETYQPSRELPPSEVTSDEPALARLIGAGGAGIMLLGIIAVVANQFSPRWIPASWGYFFAAVGLAGMLFHALRDGNIEIRRLYAGFGMIALLAAVVAAFAPGPVFSDAVAKTTGYHMLPWTPVFAMAALAFLVAPLACETDAWFRNMTLLLLLALGAILCAGCVFAGVAYPDFLTGPGVLLAFVGLAYIVAFLAHTDTTEGISYFIALGLGFLGGIALAYALGRSIFPTVLTDGPSAVKNAYQQVDYWKAGARGLSVLFFLGIAALGITRKRMSVVGRGSLAAIGISFAGVFLYATFTQTAMSPKEPYFIPTGLLMILIGLIYLGVSLGTVSDHAFVTLTRRELAAYFASPIAYFVLIGMAIYTWVGYWIFLGLLSPTVQGGSAVPEPILQDYLPGSYMGPISILMLVPAITMRLFSEERRSGTLEVLLTAPLSETTIALSKIFAAWLFYMVCWIPMGLYLIALRVVGEQPFDYRPLLSLYIAIAASGFAFVAMGAFFSSLTKNQIVAAVLTFVMLAISLFLRFHVYLPISVDSVKSVLSALASVSYWPLWMESLKGQLLVRDLILQVSIGLFWTFLTLKSLEARKWG